MEQPSTKKALFKRCEIKIGSQGLLLLIGLKVLVMMTSLQNLFWLLKASWCWWDQTFWKRWPGSKMLNSLVIFIKNFDPRRPWAPKITIFCSEVIMTRTFKPIKSRRPWLPILISHLFNKVVLVLGHSF